MKIFQYNPEPDSAESDTGKKGTRFSTRGQPGSRRSARNRRSTSEEEETPTSDEDFSDEPKKRKVTPRAGKVHGRTRTRGRGRKAKDTESEEDQSETESDKSEVLFSFIDPLFCDLYCNYTVYCIGNTETKIIYEK